MYVTAAGESVALGLFGEHTVGDARHPGADIKTVQARMRHASAPTKLDTYGHLWPDADESTRAAVGAVITARIDSVEIAADPLRTEAT